MKPADLAKSGTESGQQRALFAAINAELWQLKCQEAHSATPKYPMSQETARMIGMWDHKDRRHLAPLRWCHAIPNGGSRGESARGRAIAGAAMKAEGVIAGIPDVFLPFPTVIGLSQWAGLYIEMKKAIGGRVSEEQKEFGTYARSVGYAWHVCYTWEEAFSVLIAYLEG